MDFEYLLKVVFSFGLVIAIFLFAITIFRKLHPSYFGINTSSELSKLKFEEQLYLTPKQRIVVISYDNQKYVLLLGDTELVIDKITKGSDL